MKKTSFIKSVILLIFGGFISKIASMINFIKTLVKDYYHLDIPVVFGGSINKDNINELLKNKNIDGFMICSSILNPDNITKIMTKIQLQ